MVGKKCSDVVECEVMMFEDISFSGVVVLLLTNVVLNDGGGVAFVFQMG